MLPRGAVDLADGRPSHDVKLLAATSMLVARDDLHPALVSLLLGISGVDIATPPEHSVAA